MCHFYYWFLLKRPEYDCYSYTGIATHLVLTVILFSTLLLSIGAKKKSTLPFVLPVASSVQAACEQKQTEPHPFLSVLFNFRVLNGRMDGACSIFFLFKKIKIHRDKCLFCFVFFALKSMANGCKRKGFCLQPFATSV